jgi:hypothetical protein
MSAEAAEALVLEGVAFKDGHIIELALWTLTAARYTRLTSASPTLCAAPTRSTCHLVFLSGLPDSICELHQLQDLDLTGCKDLTGTSKDPCYTCLLTWAL